MSTIEGPRPAPMSVEYEAGWDRELALSPSQPVVLIVDDEKCIADFLPKGVAALGYLAHYCATAEDAKAFIEKGGKVALALVDGDLGDGKFGRDSQSYNLVNDVIIKHGIPYIRMTGSGIVFDEEVGGTIRPALRKPFRLFPDLQIILEENAMAAKIDRSY